MEPSVSTLAFLPNLGAAPAIQAFEEALAGHRQDFLLPYELNVREPLLRSSLTVQSTNAPLRAEPQRWFR